MNRTLIPAGTGVSLFDEFRNEMDNLMSRFFHDRNGGGEVTAWVPRLNLAETEKSYEVTVDLPGLKPDEVDIELRHGDLWITGQRKSEFEEKGKTWHRIERAQGEFRRVIHLGDDVDPEQVSAEYKDGVLSVSVPKTEHARSKKIAIKT